MRAMQNAIAKVLHRLLRRLQRRPRPQTNETQIHHNLKKSEIMKHLLIAAALFLQLSAPGQALIVDYTKTVCPGSEMTVKLVADPGIVWVTIWTTEWPISYPIEFPFDADTLIVQLAVPDFFSGQCWIYSYNTDQKYQPV